MTVNSPVANLKVVGKYASGDNVVHISERVRGLLRPTTCHVTIGGTIAANGANVVYTRGAVVGVCSNVVHDHVYIAGTMTGKSA